MRKTNKQSMFLATVAAIALFAATGAFAQGQLDQKGGAEMKAPSGVQTQRSDQGAKNQGGMSGQNSGQNSQSALGRDAAANFDDPHVVRIERGICALHLQGGVGLQALQRLTALRGVSRRSKNPEGGCRAALVFVRSVALH